ncbi:ribosome maturation factor RimM [Jeotgalibaca sp. PTS2502]|jgi:16S rRNA processing protein RimM|uniref:Ribosome maturation factor RimM n=1 Tax=Candidatus Jeotgalibaca merdavium TaxID=2838627 RepID=A0A9D2KVB7_9LACT|nr:ribosome maturation factor RimM [Jeotgalibaca sp. PTS2502]APZ48944.1 ribosome maturation factor RimM [Jeotgalibaca sp. PTS2502]HJA89172.1 ribosome maturation factor RimM [Candidatus Jeotgalibaca merdavium]
MENYLAVGKIVNTQGLKGEVRVISVTDFVNERYKKGALLTIFQDGKETVEVTVKSHRKHKNFDLLTFENHPRIEDVEIYKGSELKVSKEHIQELEGEDYYYHQIIGLSVVTDEGEELGEIKEILSPGANDVWVVKGKAKKDILLPYIDDVVKEVNLEEGRVVVSIMEGLLD